MNRALGSYAPPVLAIYDPDVRPQGSFRYGTVNRPLRDDDSYDLDNICVLRSLSKALLTQKQLKDLYGKEIRAYAAAHNMLKPVEEHNRCWRLPYSDEVEFHLDTLPCVPEDAALVARLVAAGIPPRAYCGCLRSVMAMAQSASTSIGSWLMRIPDWQQLTLDDGILREPVPDKKDLAVVEKAPLSRLYG